MQFDSTAFPKDWFEGLNTKSMQCRGTVQENWMFFDYLFQGFPYTRANSFNLAFSSLDVGCLTAFYQTFHNERFEQFQCHFFRQTTLVHFKFRTYYDNGTTRVVNTFTKQVLTETTLFTFKHIGQGFQWTVTRTCYRTTTATIIDQCVNSFLKHTFFVAHDDIRST